MLLSAEKGGVYRIGRFREGLWNGLLSPLTWVERAFYLGRKGILGRKDNGLRWKGQDMTNPWSILASTWDSGK